MYGAATSSDNPATKPALITAARTASLDGKVSSTCNAAIVLPAPERRPLQPATSELNSQALCVVRTLTGRGRFCSVRMCHS